MSKPTDLGPLPAEGSSGAGADPRPVVPQSALPQVVHTDGRGYLDLRNAIAPQINLTDGNTQNVHLPPLAPPAWPIQVGRIPGLATAFQPRPGLRDRITAARPGTGNDSSSAGVVLTQAVSSSSSSSSPGSGFSGSGGSAGVLSGGGGVGKSQLAAWFAGRAVRDRTDLVVWVDASAPGGLVTAYAQAGARVQAPGASGLPADAEADAQAFLEWVQGTDRSWLIVLDDLTDPDAVTGWWPVSHTGTGWVLATTRRRDEVLFGGGRRRVDVDVYTEDEATGYLGERLADAGKPHLLDDRVAALAAALGRLPLALSHAAAYMITRRVTCGAYLDLYTAGVQRLDQLMPGDPDGHARRPGGTTLAVTVTLLLALDTADTQDPVGLARPAMMLAAVLDPAGHPETLWATDAARTWLATHRTPPTGSGDGTDDPSSLPPVTAWQARDALLLLDRYGLATLDEQAGPRAVRVHALTARAAGETTTAGQTAAAVRAAADALLELWPAAHHDQPDLTAALRANTTTLTGHDTQTSHPLWTRDDGAHPLLWRTGLSLLQAGLHTPASVHWEHTSTTALRILGPEHSSTLTALGNLAASYWRAGRTHDAITIEEQVTAAMARILGPEHPSTLTALGNLAASYWQAGRTHDAITILEQVTAAMARILGPEHPSTLTAQANLAASYSRAGRTHDAITILEQVAAASVAILGPEHPDTLSAQANLAASNWQASRTHDAITLGKQVAADRVRILGPEHPDTLTAQANLAAFYRQASRTHDAITILEQVTAAMARILGPEHPSTLTAQNNLAEFYSQAGRTHDAITIDEQVAAATARILGPEHPDTLTAQANLAASYRQAGRTQDAITIEEKVAATFVRILGPEHPSTRAVVAALQQ